MMIKKFENKFNKEKMIKEIIPRICFQIIKLAIK